MFIDAKENQIKAAKDCGAPFIEIHTGHYADAKDEKSKASQYRLICEGVNYAKSMDLMVNAGHGLHYHNVAPIAAIPEIYELNIGHAIIAQSVFSGLAKAVADMKAIMLSARQ